MLSIRRPKSLVFCLLFKLALLSGPVNANEYAVNFDFAAQSPIEELLINKSTLKDVFGRLQLFSSQNFKLKRNITFHFGNDSFISVDESKENNYLITIPFSFLYQLHQIVSNNYPQQMDVQASIYASAVEKLLWIELGRVLIRDYELHVEGNELFALDNFSMLMLLNQHHETTDYLLDATEVYLITEQAFPYLDHSAAEDEASLDEERYRKAVCFILGKDYATKLKTTQQPYIQLISELAWDQKKIELCKKLYDEKLATWIESLTPHLAENNTMSKWLSPANDMISKTETNQKEVLMPLNP